MIARSLLEERSLDKTDLEDRAEMKTEPASDAFLNSLN